MRRRHQVVLRSGRQAHSEPMLHDHRHVGKLSLKNTHGEAIEGTTILAALLHSDTTTQFHYPLSQQSARKTWAKRHAKYGGLRRHRFASAQSTLR